MNLKKLIFLSVLTLLIVYFSIGFCYLRTIKNMGVSYAPVKDLLAHIVSYEMRLRKDNIILPYAFKELCKERFLKNEYLYLESIIDFDQIYYREFINDTAYQYVLVWFGPDGEIDSNSAPVYWERFNLFNAFMYSGDIILDGIYTHTRPGTDLFKKEFKK
jgi:hypothetical protein